ncbi:mitochondrial carrier [Fusarium flagelliforme]|uniref:Mitochondrial carrier n=1 Tax=Fusarium flagelliforme TaxID=2675880 RepID=A0A395M6V1_9HYPO|nr:mitochondrial carrier [Fusarium flagelliforme]
MPSKRHEPSSGSSQGAEKGRTGIHEHDKRPHEPAPRLSHLEHLTVRVSDNSIRSLAGATSAIASSIVTSPLDVMKIKLQGRGGLQLWTLDSVRKRRSFQERGLIGTGRAIWHEGGFIGMYQGLGPTMLANIPRGAIYFTVYHKINDSLKKVFRLGNWHEGQEWLQILGVLTASVASKACATIATYPHEVVRTRLQTQQKVYLSSPIEHARARDGGGLLMRGSSSQSEKVCNAGKIWERFPRLNWGVMSTLEMISREEGWRALYSGMGTSLIGAIPASAMTMLVYEAVVWQIKKSRTQGKRKLEMQDIPEMSRSMSTLPTGSGLIQLENGAYVPGFHWNLINTHSLEQQGLYFQHNGLGRSLLLRLLNLPWLL